MAINETKVGNVFVGQTQFGSVELRIGQAGRGSRYEHFTAIDAKRLAYALLLAADLVADEKAFTKGERIPSAKN